MKKLFTILLLLNLNLNYAQTYYPLLRQNVYWDVFNYNTVEICGLVAANRYFINGDTTFNGTDYKIISAHPIISLNQPAPFCPPFGVNGNTTFLTDFYMREDTVAQQVYVFDFWNNQEDLLYDFSLQVGDSTSNYAGGGTPFVIDSIGSYLMPDGTSRRVFYGTPYFYVEFYIEGVGTSTGLFEPINRASRAGSYLTCVLDSNVQIYADSIIVSGCQGFVGLNEELQENELVVYPNPAKGELKIISINGSFGNFKIMDVTGKLVHSSFINNANTIINLEKYKNGIYIYQYEISPNRIVNGKIVVLN